MKSKRKVIASAVLLAIALLALSLAFYVLVGERFGESALVVQFMIGFVTGSALWLLIKGTYLRVKRRQ